MDYNIDDDIKWYSEYQDELVKKYEGKTIAIRNPLGKSA